MLRVILLPVLLMSAAVAGAEEVDLVARLLERVQHLREVLGPELSGKMLHEFDEKGRTEWSFFPGEHPGVAIGACTEEQQAALLEVLRVALSASGFEKTELVRGIDDVLGKTDGPQYTSGNYFLSVWGEPGAKGPWSLRWEGHHISLHWLIRDGRVMASTPQFLGSHPALVEDEGPLKGAGGGAGAGSGDVSGRGAGEGRDCGGEGLCGCDYAFASAGGAAGGCGDSVWGVVAGAAGAVAGADSGVYRCTGGAGCGAAGKGADAGDAGGGEVCMVWRHGAGAEALLPDSGAGLGD
jgi:hypothetical protein